MIHNSVFTFNNMYAIFTNRAILGTNQALLYASYRETSLHETVASLFHALAQLFICVCICPFNNVVYESFVGRDPCALLNQLLKP